MVRDRVFGEDKPFLGWMRKCPDLPESGCDFGWVQTDCDTVMHRYKFHVDSEGSREVQALMLLEIKTRNGEPSPSQKDTLFKVHQFRGWRVINESGTRSKIWHAGVSIVSLSGTTPEDSERISWGRFADDAEIRWDRIPINWREIDIYTLVRLLRFDIDPDDFSPNRFRRHHKTQCIHGIARAEMGFLYEERKVLRS